MGVDAAVAARGCAEAVSVPVLEEEAASVCVCVCVYLCVCAEGAEPAVCPTEGLHALCRLLVIFSGWLCDEVESGTSGLQHTEH